MPEVGGGGGVCQSGQVLQDPVGLGFKWGPGQSAWGGRCIQREPGVSECPCSLLRPWNQWFVVDFEQVLNAGLVSSPHQARFVVFGVLAQWSGQRSESSSLCVMHAGRTGFTLTCRQRGERLTGQGRIASTHRWLRSPLSCEPPDSLHRASEGGNMQEKEHIEPKCFGCLLHSSPVRPVSLVESFCLQGQQLPLLKWTGRTH